MDRDGSVTLFKELGQPARAGEVLDRYIETHKNERALFNLGEHPFGARITNPDLVNRFNAQFATFGRIAPVCPSGQTLQGWVVWSSVPITQAGTNVNEREVPVRMKYRQLLAVAAALALRAG
jgi:hypothetical protein